MTGVWYQSLVNHSLVRARLTSINNINLNRTSTGDFSVDILKKCKFLREITFSNGYLFLADPNTSCITASVELAKIKLNNVTKVNIIGCSSRTMTYINDMTPNVTVADIVGERLDKLLVRGGWRNLESLGFTCTANDRMEHLKGVPLGNLRFLKIKHNVSYSIGFVYGLFSELSKSNVETLYLKMENIYRFQPPGFLLF